MHVAAKQSCLLPAVPDHASDIAYFGYATLVVGCPDFSLIKATYAPKIVWLSGRCVYASWSARCFSQVASSHGCDNPNDLAFTLV